MSESWPKLIGDGRLVLKDNKQHGSAKGTIPLIVVAQQNKDKELSVRDFQELDSHLSLHMVDTGVGGEKVKEWRRRGQ